jgi:hypothetical protein
VIEQNAARAELAHCLSVVAHEEHRASFTSDVFHLAEAFLLERRVADSEHFVDEKNLGL